jgi:hypothetical protein
MHNRHHRKATIREGVKEFRSQEASIASGVFSLIAREGVKGRGPRQRLSATPALHREPRDLLDM